MEPVSVSPEALLAATGIRRILSGDFGRITVADKEKADMLPREIRRSMARFAAEDDGLKPVGKREKFDYAWVLEHLTEALEPVEGQPMLVVKPQLLEDIVDGFRPEDHDLTTAYMARVQAVLPYLYSVMPIRTEQTSAKTVNFDPSDTEIAKFRRAYDVADDPLVVCRDMEAGTLVEDQVAHLEATYPLMFKNLKAQLAGAMAEAMTRKKSWKLPWRKERIVQLVYGTDTMSPDLARDLAASFAQEGMNEPKPGPPPAKSTAKSASMVQSQTQATADGDLRK